MAQKVLVVDVGETQSKILASGQVKGQGLAANFKQRFPSWLVRVVIVALLAANTINIGADLAGISFHVIGLWINVDKLLAPEKQ